MRVVLGDAEERVSIAVVIALVALSLIGSICLGIVLERRVGSAIWLRTIAATAIGGSLVLLWMALSAYAGNCAGRDYGVEDYYPADWQIMRVLYIVAWPSACLTALSVGFFTSTSASRPWMAALIGLAITAALFFALNFLLQPPLFEPCAPTPVL